MKYACAGLLLLCFGICLWAEDQIILSDGQRVDGTILSTEGDIIVIKKADNTTQKYPRKIVSSIKYKDGTNWAKIETWLREHQYTLVVSTIQKDAKKHPHGGSLRQIKNVVYCLRQLRNDKMLTEWCHEVCRHKRTDIMQIIDLFVAVDQSDKFESLEKHWLYQLKHSRYQLGRRRCALILALIYKINNVKQTKIDLLLKKHQVDKEADLSDLYNVIKGNAVTKVSVEVQAMDAYQSIIVRRLIADKAYDEAALTALRIGLDENVDVLKRAGFLSLAAEALKTHAPKESQTILTLSQKIQR